ncbi:hypothetical protein [uncultured Dokdonia sp.]|uniref:hypothetical protein n=1 Tax=uncultured Dokdonia sp. TaxID=575653 RepID=UPI0026234175|nr:hypothetical protein [uncultured Dokdonia sp.]
MEKFSNNRDHYWDQIKIELLEINDFENFRFQYLEMGQLFSHGFSITQIEKNSKELILKIWNAEYDNKRFDKEIFNLSRLAITDSKIELNVQESETINKLLNTELSLTNYKGIVLDGLFCQLEFDNKKMNWNINEEINDDLTQLVKFLRSKVPDNTI